MILVIDNYDSFTYNLVQLLAALGAEVEVRRNDALTAEEALALRPAGIVVSPGPGHAGRRRHLARRRPCGCRGGRAACSACVSATSASPRSSAARVCRAPRAGARQDRRGQPRRRRVCSPASPARSRPRATTRCASTRDSVPDVARGPGRDTPDGVDHGAAPPRAARVRRPVPPRERADPRGREAARQLPRRHRRGAARAGRVGTPAVVAAAGGSARASAGDGRGRPRRRGRSVASRRARRSPRTRRTLVMGQIMDGEATPSQISALVTAMRMKGETVDEIVGFARAMRERATPVRPTRDRLHRHLRHRRRRRCTPSTSPRPPRSWWPAPACPWPSTATARSLGSGSADVLEALGVDITLGADGRGAVHRRGGHRLPVRASRCTRACATPAGPRARSASGPSSTSWGRSPTRPARSASCWASTTRVSRR